MVLAIRLLASIGIGIANTFSSVVNSHAKHSLLNTYNDRRTTHGI